MNAKIRNKFIEIKYSVSNGLELFILFAASAFRKLSSVYVFSYFPFGFEGKIWDLIVSVPDHCLSFYFVIFITNNWWFRILEISRYL